MGSFNCILNCSDLPTASDVIPELLSHELMFGQGAIMWKSAEMEIPWLGNLQDVERMFVQY